jgi:hypothetical protein
MNEIINIIQANYLGGYSIEWGIEDPGTVRKRDFEEMPWCNQGAGLREETASIEDPGTVRKRDFEEMPWCSQGAGLREETASIEDPGTVRKRDFEEMPWCSQGAGLREETASTAWHHRAEWGGQEHFAEDSFAGDDAVGGADQSNRRLARRARHRGAMQVKDCRKAAPKEEQVGKTCESNERERTNQWPDCFVARGRHGVSSVIDGMRRRRLDYGTTDYRTTLQKIKKKQASLHGILKTHRSLAPRAALLFAPCAR